MPNLGAGRRKTMGFNCLRAHLRARLTNTLEIRAIVWWLGVPAEEPSP